MYKPLLYLLLTILPYNLAAQQNLVPNPSFEEVIVCPEHREEIEKLYSWVEPNGSSPDIHHRCTNTIDFQQVPQNGFGWQLPRTGDAYIGFHSNPPEVREYVQCKLLSPLDMGEDYVLEFFVSHADSSTTACDNIGAALTEFQISSSNAQLLNNQPQVMSVLGHPITDKFNWVQVSDTITATGMEQYLTIGVFSNDSNTTWQTVQGGWDASAYYYLDDVSLVKLSKDVTLPNVFTPNGDGINDFFNPHTSGFTSVRLSIFNRWGIQVYSSCGEEVEWDGTIDNSSAETGVYFVVLELEDEIGNMAIEKGYVHLLR